MISPEQEQQIKKQLLEQIDSTFPEDKKAEAKAQIESMTGEPFVEFLKQNNLIKTDDTQQGQQCVFCSIIYGDIPSTKIGENEKAISVLELNPISKAHAIVIPKEHISKEEDLPNEARILATEIAEKIKEKFKPKDIVFFNTNMFGHEIINILPIYTNETKDSPKKQSTPEELKQVADELSQTKEETIEEKPQEEITEENTWLPNRIP
jgi:diadenosine tetraphosphate (Ap4A) HIT family hydrolase